MTKTLNQIFFPPPKSEYFFSNIGNQNMFLEKTSNTHAHDRSLPWLNWCMRFNKKYLGHITGTGNISHRTIEMTKIPIIVTEPNGLY